MARRMSFRSATLAMVREAERQRKAAEKQQRQLLREQQRRIRELERERRQQSKEDKQRYLESRQEEAETMNRELEEQLTALRSILEHTLSVDDTISFDSLRIVEPYQPIPIPQSLTLPQPAPQREQFLSKVKPPTLLESALRMKGRYHRELLAAEAQYEAARRAYEQLEHERQSRLRELQAQDEAAQHAYQQRVHQRNQEVNELKANYERGDISAVIAYNVLVLERSQYPDTFPQEFRLAYEPEPKELVIEYELPDLTIVPHISEYKYNKSKDTIDGKPRKQTEIKEIYQDIIASVALRSIHEVLEADQGGHIEVVVFNGFVRTIDAATGRDIAPHLVSVRATRQEFQEINLARVNKQVCLRNLGARVSPQPQAMQPVKPVIDFNMVDKRFVEQGDVLSELESRPNLMELTPGEFETLVSNLFSKMGLETRLTRSSRDGGVDVVAYDVRPILGGKVVIQAKRYRNVVGVSAIRDLYGTMVNEGANKGIIVTTSNYGPDAYEFAKDKPIELIDGGGLLYLLNQVGIEARIVMPEEGS